MKTTSTPARDDRPSAAERHPQPGSLDAALESWIDEGCHGIGQIHIAREGSGYALCHEDDVDKLRGNELELHQGHAAARHLALHDDEGNYRPLKSAPNLRHGWKMALADVHELRLALDAFHPAAVGMWFRESRDQLEAVPLRTTLQRQTGMYRFTGGISHKGAVDMVQSACRHRKCLRKVRWDIEPGDGNPALGPDDTDPSSLPWGRESGRIPLLCMEICCHVVGAARKIAKAEFESKSKEQD